MNKGRPHGDSGRTEAKVEPSRVRVVVWMAFYCAVPCNLPGLQGSMPRPEAIINLGTGRRENCGFLPIEGCDLFRCDPCSGSRGDVLGSEVWGSGA